MTNEELQTALLVELGTIETYKGDSVRKLREFWKAVANRNIIRSELKKRVE